MAVELLGPVPEIVLWYLLTMIFDGVLRQQPYKLSATGQELGSSMLFSSRIGQRSLLMIYALVSSVNTHSPPMVWSPLALARGLGPGLRLGKTTSQPSSLYLLHVA